MRTILY